jgi:hypothetical protein
MGGIDWTAEPVKLWQDGRHLAEALADGAIEFDDPGLPGIYRIGESSGTGNVGHAFGVDGTDDESSRDVGFRIECSIWFCILTNKIAVQFILFCLFACLYLVFAILTI